MEHFAKLIHRLEISNKTNDKIDAIVDYLQMAPDGDKSWLVALFTGRRPKRPVKTTLMRAWALELTKLPEWMFLESYSNVGDLSETISLVLPPPVETINKSISEWMKELTALSEKSDQEKKDYVLKAWQGLNYRERFIFNKFIGGGFRIGVSYKMLVNALARYSGKDANTIMHSISGKWHPQTTTFSELVEGHHVNADNSKPYPFCLAYPLEKPVEELGPVCDWQAEWKWDGIRGQMVKRGGELFLWSRGEELVSEQFPELMALLQELPNGVVLDGEILVFKDGVVMPFNELQKRLNRKNPSRKVIEQMPVCFYAYDLLEMEGKDLRGEQLLHRCALLEKLLQTTHKKHLQLSPILEVSSWETLTDLRERAREVNSEGLMLKQKNSLYHSGRKKGDWWKWKISPLSVDAVLIYAQKGSGRRSAFHTDYTFAVREGEKLVTVAKAYSGLTDQEIKEVDRFVKQNAVEKFGPVRTVKPQLVFEIGFEGIAASNRHKSGVALRFPRILRWRHDKKLEDIDTIEGLKDLLSKFG